MIGKPLTPKYDSFGDMFNKQIAFQHKVELKNGKLSSTLPTDDPKMFQYHMTAMTEELGEVLKADKRWKTHRNKTFAKEEKLDEIADVFITTMNIAMWSGFSHEDVYNAVIGKIGENTRRIEEEG